MTSGFSEMISSLPGIVIRGSARLSLLLIQRLAQEELRGLDGHGAVGALVLAEQGQLQVLIRVPCRS